MSITPLCCFVYFHTESFFGFSQSASKDDSAEFDYYDDADQLPPEYAGVYLYLFKFSADTKVILLHFCYLRCVDVISVFVFFSPLQAKVVKRLQNCGAQGVAAHLKRWSKLNDLMYVGESEDIKKRYHQHREQNLFVDKMMRAYLAEGFV